MSTRPLTDHEWRRLDIAVRIYLANQPDEYYMSREAALARADAWIAAARLDAPTEEKPTNDSDVWVDGVMSTDFYAYVHRAMMNHLTPGARYRVTFTKIEEGGNG